jgi:hypothetical protein
MAYTPDPKTAKQRRQNDKALGDLWKQRKKPLTYSAKKRYRRARQEEYIKNTQKT